MQPRSSGIRGNGKSRIALRSIRATVAEEWLRQRRCDAQSIPDFVSHRPGRYGDDGNPGFHSDHQVEVTPEKHRTIPCTDRFFRSFFHSHPARLGVRSTFP